jgi:site-specific recombinase XerD
VLPNPIVQALRVHRKTQLEQRMKSRQLWEEHGLVFCQANGRPLDPRKDHAAWKQLLKTAGVRDARLHDARHTAATILLVQGVDPRTVMDLLGWSQVSMTRRYQHVVDELRAEAARRIESALWGQPERTETKTETKARRSRTR